MAISAPRSPKKTDRGLRHPLHHHPHDTVHEIPRRHRRFKCGWKYGQASAHPVPAHRGGRHCSHHRRGGARGTAKQHRRDRRPGTSAVQRNRRPLSEGSRRRVRSCATPRPDTGAAVSRSDRSCRWAKRASATSVWTNGSGGNPAYYQARANGVNAADEGFKTDWRSRAR